MAGEMQVWSPFRELDRFRRDFDDLFDRFFGGRPAPEVTRVSAPALESFIRDGDMVIRADLPGIEPKDVEVTITGDILTLRGKRSRNIEEEKHDYFHSEIAYGSFERSVRLPEGVKSEEVKATFKHGMLELVIPIPKQMTARKVPIEIEGGKP